MIAPFGTLTIETDGDIDLIRAGLSLTEAHEAEYDCEVVRMAVLSALNEKYQLLRGCVENGTEVYEFGKGANTVTLTVGAEWLSVEYRR